MTWIQLARDLNYILTLFALPLAILAFIVFLYVQRRWRRNQQEDNYRRLSGEYADFLKLVLANPDLKLLRKGVPDQPLSAEQHERKLALFNILISLFERAYLLVFEERMHRQTRRLWLSLEDYMREWCRRRDFRDALPELLQGEDEDFQAHIQKIADDEATKAHPLGAASSRGQPEENKRLDP